MIQPNFLFIGASKAGSTWIYEILREHPEVFVPAAKDVQFFDYYYDKGFEWYYNHFRDAGSARAIGEVSHDYFLEEVYAERIHAALPEARLICCLREPVQKTVSAYVYHRSTSLDHDTSFADFSARSDVRQLSEYRRNLAPFYARYPADRILVLFYDELQNDPARFAERIFSFLGVDPAFVPSKLRKVVLAAQEPRMVWAAHTAYKVALVLRKMGLANVVGRVKRSPLVERLLYRKLPKRPEVDADERQHLFEYFAQEYDALEQLIGQALPAAWRQPVAVGQGESA